MTNTEDGEGNTTTTVTGEGEPGATVIVKDADGNVVGEGTVDEDGTFEVELDKPFTNGEELEVSLKDEAGNESDSVLVNAPDTTAPDAPDAEIDESNAVLTVKTEPNATVKVYDSEGKPLLDSNGNAIEFQADENGDASYTFEPALDRGKILNVTATDAAGNESEPTKVIAGAEEILATSDNYVDVVLDATPTKTDNPKPSDLNKGGFVVASVGLGPVLGVDVLADVLKKSVILEVEEGTVREVTLHGVSGGVQLLGTMDLYAYKLNESTGEWEQQSVNKNWLVAVLLGGRSKDTDFTLTQGKWMFTMASGEGVQALTGFELKFTKDVVLDYANAESVSGSAEGNMITDDDPKYGADEVPEGSTVTAIKDGNGNWLDTSANGEIVVEGKYGTLVVKADGSYTYTVNVSTEENEEITFFLDSEESEQVLPVASTDNVAVESAALDVQPVVDPLDDLLEQNTTLI
ncbi:Ig-like domain-containing protein [Thiopseudomonas alkaliphila]|uniref:Ig-like domain-containing protein n=1 Tax=Thiopseudomonas alkaliphila TaxID=1697053 RepID=UPI0007DC08CD|nr:Ig-like domain-containing protein [Thiopseudomonas alkaliphila]